MGSGAHHGVHGCMNDKVSLDLQFECLAVIQMILDPLSKAEFDDLRHEFFMTVVRYDV